MSYYKIKCVYCLEDVPSYSALYRLNVNDLEFGYTERDSDNYSVEDDLDDSFFGNAMTGMGGGNDMFSSGLSSDSDALTAKSVFLPRQALFRSLRSQCSEIPQPEKPYS